MYCDCLEVTRQGFYWYLQHQDDPWKYEELAKKMEEIVAEDECNDTYGRCRMREALALKYPEEKLPGERTVYRIMERIGLSHLTKEGIKVYTIKRELFDVGRTEMQTIHGNTVACYNLERTICDIVRSRSKIDSQVYLDAIKGYFRRRDKNLIHLTTYSRLFHVESILRPYWEVLL